MSQLCAKIKKTKDRLAQLRVMGIKPNFSKIAEETGLDRHCKSRINFVQKSRSIMYILYP